jgi:hypothetical protein
MDPFSSERIAQDKARLQRQRDGTMNGIESLVDDFKTASRPLIGELDRVTGDSAKQFPAEYVAAERLRITGELKALEGHMMGRVTEVHQREVAIADEVYAKDVRDPAAVTADELTIQRLARLHPEKSSARVQLLPEARRFAMIGDPERAAVYLEAARLAGATDPQTERLVNNALDAKLPNRKAALEARQQSVKDYADAQIAASTTRNLAAALAGDRIGAAQASVAAKSAAYEKSVREGTAYQEPAGLRLVGQE